MSFIKTEHEIVVAFDGNLNDAFDTVRELLNHTNLNDNSIAEIMLSVFKAGKVAGKRELKQQILGL